MNWKKNKILTLCAFLMAITMMAACNGGTPSETETESTLQESQSSEEKYYNLEGYPIVNDPITLKFFTVRWPAHNDYHEMEVVKAHAERTNINIEWDMVPIDSVDERKNLLFASKQLPDVFFGQQLTPMDHVVYGEQGLLIPLNDLISKYAPNLSKILEENPTILSSITAPDGNIYTLFDFTYTLHMRAQNKLFINQSWLDDLGLNTPNTISEFYDVLNSFKNAYPTSIPMTIEPGNIIKFMGPWGVIDNQIAVNGKIKLGYMEDGFKEGLKFFAKLYDENLLDPEVFTQSYAQLSAKGSGTDLVYGAFFRLADSQVVGANRTHYSGFGPMEGPDGTKLFNVRNIPILRKFSITSANKYPEATMRWLDYLYTTQGTVEFSRGVEGEQWEWTDDGKYLVLPEPEGKTFAEWRHLNAPGGVSPGFAGEEIVQMTAYDIELAEITEMYLPYAPEEILPEDMYFTKEQYEALAPLETSITPYVSEMTAKFITGDASIENQWNEYIDTLNRMGAQDLLAIWQSAYETYRSNLG